MGAVEGRIHFIQPDLSGLPKDLTDEFLFIIYHWISTFHPRPVVSPNQLKSLVPQLLVVNVGD